MIRTFVCFSIASGVAVACGGAPVPHDQMSAAQAAVRAAEVGGAQSDPQAALQLKRANDQIAEAKARIEDGDNEEALRLLQRAEADAEVALVMAQEQSGRTAAMKAQQEVNELRAQLKEAGN